MAVRTRNSRSAKNEPIVVLPLWRRLLARYFPAWVLLAFILFSLLPTLIVSAAAVLADAVEAAPGAALDVGEFAIKGVITVAEVGVDVAGDMLSAAGHLVEGLFSKSHSGQPEEIAALFTDQVDYWADDIERWSKEYSLDPNLLATVMQIESCGHPNVASHAGAQGLFQVMPMHFATGEVMVDPDTNAMRGAGVLNYCLEQSNGDPGLAMACYNGGPSVLWTPFDQWLNEPQRYYVWGTGIYADAQKDSENSATLSEWLNAGGVNLCNRASNELGLS